jgi:hypothetical protein
MWMPMRVAVLLSSVALVVAAGAQATPTRGTLTGIVTRGPITPVCAIEVPCDEPAANVTLLFTRNDAVVGRAVTNDAGRYRLRLPAGTYGVRRPGASGPFDRKLEPNHARVYAGRSNRVDFSIDTGIR